MKSEASSREVEKTIGSCQINKLFTIPKMNNGVIAAGKCNGDCPKGGVVLLVMEFFLSWNSCCQTTD